MDQNVIDAWTVVRGFALANDPDETTKRAIAMLDDYALSEGVEFIDEDEDTPEPKRGRDVNL